MVRIYFRNVMISVCVLTLLCFSVSIQAFAVSDNFTITTLVGSDTNPPTIPGGFTATPVATTQIDLAWTASTDDFLLSGYQVYRDDVLIGTTTGIAYVDSGLTASTTYNYYVTAFDSSNNVSGSSTVVATTTLSPAPPVVTATSSESTTKYGSRINLTNQILSMQIVPGKDSVTIRYTTRNNIQSSIRYGRTPSYELGIIGEEIFSKNHVIRITDLTPGTPYTFQISGIHGTGAEGTLFEEVFTTSILHDTLPPENVVNLEAWVEDATIRLRWENPLDADFKYVRVLRSDRFYPQDQADGWVVYEGTNQTVQDMGVEDLTKTIYYTVFTYDMEGNISSGAVVAVSPPRVSHEEETHVNVLDITFADFDFIQEGKSIAQDGAIITLDGSRRFMISLPYEKVPEHLKTILVKLTDTSRDKSFSFILKVNEGKTAYTSVIGAIGFQGEFKIEISIFDYEQGEIGYAQGLLKTNVVSVPVAGTYEGTLITMIRFFARDGFMFLLLLVLLITLFVSARKILTTKFS